MLNRELRVGSPNCFAYFHQFNFWKWGHFGNGSALASSKWNPLMYIVRFYDYILWLWLKTADLHNRKRLKKQTNELACVVIWNENYLFFLLFHHKLRKKFAGFAWIIPSPSCSILNWNTVVDFFKWGWFLNVSSNRILKIAFTKLPFDIKFGN